MAVVFPEWGESRCILELQGNRWMDPRSLAACFIKGCGTWWFWWVSFTRKKEFHTATRSMHGVWDPSTKWCMLNLAKLCKIQPPTTHGRPCTARGAAHWRNGTCRCACAHFVFFCGRGTAWDCLISHGASALMQERLLWWRECAHMQIPSLPQIRCISSLIVFPVWAMCIPRQQGMSPLFPGAGEEQYPRRCGGAIQLQVIAARDGCHGNRCAGDDGKCRSRMTKKVEIIPPL